MKQDRKWLKNQIEIMGTETSENYPHEQMVDREVVLKLVEKLDEPEITEEQALNKLAEKLPMSADQLFRHFNRLAACGGNVRYGRKPEITQEQAWETLAPRFSMTAEELERQVVDGFLKMTMEEIEMESNKIKQLAVGIKLLHAENEELKAKLEKPVIPQFVADWIDKSKNVGYSLYGALDAMPTEVASWLILSKQEGKSEGPDTVARAWLDGYEIEKEPLYYVKLPNTNSESEYLYLAKGKSTRGCWFNNRTEKLEYESVVCRHKFTEAEIKAIDKRYWAFAEPVEDSP